MNTRLHRCGALAVLILAVGCQDASAPTAARVEGTMADVESLPATCGQTISQPGAYRLAGDITSCGTTAAITIDADDVTLHLNGFTISGNGTFGVLVQATSDRAVVRGPGTVIDFVNAIQVLGPEATVHSLAVMGLGNAGIHFNAGADNGRAFGNAIVGGRFAGLSWGADNGVARRNVITGHENGMFFDPATSGHLLRNNTVTGASNRGVYFNASNSRLRDNEFTGATVFDFVNLQGCSGNNRILAGNVIGAGDNLCNAVPAAPPAVSVEVDADMAEVSWTDPDLAETRFEVARRVLAGGVWGPWETIETTGTNATTATPVPVEAGNRYKFRVRGCNGLGCSSWTKAAPFTHE